MKIVVIGGSGLIGAKLVAVLQARGHSVVAASRRTGVDIVTGEGLADAVVGADAVVDVSRSPSMRPADARRFFVTGTQNLLRAGAAADVGHHVLLSVVGARRLPGAGFLQAKVAQEDLVHSSTRSHTIVAATQFFEYVTGIADASTVGSEVRLPGVMDQPVCSDDVAAMLADVATSAPQNRTVELAGPDRFRLPEFVAIGLRALGDPRQVVADDSAKYFGATVTGDELLPGPDAHIGAVHHRDWLSTRPRRTAG